MNRDLDLVKIHSYISGQMTAEERLNFEQELERDPLLAADVELTQKAFDVADAYRSPVWDVEEGLTQMPFTAGNADFVVGQSNKSRRVYVWLGRAATVAALVVAGLYMKERLVSDHLRYSGSEVLALQDGTEIHLNYDGSLFYPEEFANSHRTVELDGEAFFDVARDEGRRFQVNTDYASITVLGTSFSVDENDDDRTVEVYVSSGKVRVTPNSSNQYIDLTAGQSAIYDSESGSLTRNRQGDQNDISWHTRTLKWRDTDLVDVIEDLKTAFSVEIDYSELSPNLTCGHTASYPQLDDSTLNEILLSLQDVYDITAVQVGEGNYRVSGGICN